MNLYIMTRGRVGKQYTLSRLPEKWKAKTFLVCPDQEVILHAAAGETCGVIPAHPYVKDYSTKFQWILDGMPVSYEYDNVLDKEDKAVIMDDDLVFSKRNAEGKLITIRDPEELSPMFDQMEALLDTYPLVGVHPRQMGQHTKPPYVENGRIICIQGINRRLIGQVKVDQYPILADVVLNCTLLARGQRNAIISTFFQDHGPCQAEGGCSIYRTGEMQNRAVDYIAQRFGPFARTVQRHTISGWLQDEKGVRNDYTCQWKRLHAAGAAHLLDPGAVPHPDKEARR